MQWKGDNETKILFTRGTAGTVEYQLHVIG